MNVNTNIFILVDIITSHYERVYDKFKRKYILATITLVTFSFVFIVIRNITHKETNYF